MAINITDGMSAVEFKSEIESKVIDKTGDDLGTYISVGEKNPSLYDGDDVIPQSFVLDSIDSFSLFLFNSTELADSMVVDIAFGKNCEDKIYCLGKQLWNYHVVVGDSATATISGSGKTLADCKTLAEIKASALAMSQLANFPALRKLVTASPYAKQKLGVTWTS